jgi:hypothetical protein
VRLCLCLCPCPHTRALNIKFSTPQRVCGCVPKLVCASDSMDIRDENPRERECTARNFNYRLYELNNVFPSACMPFISSSSLYNEKSNYREKVRARPTA